MKINKNLQTILLCPIKGLVQILNTSMKRFSVSKYKIRNRNTNQPDSLFFDKSEILFRDKSISVLFHFFF